ncbi:Retrotransposon gag domain [Arabidopsis thaliana x Arabidopsis arenosa]|uniref:Retrotransposon gag domain n=1 Tax=Arabidopsis thaliana x Arabidopsis arenosa TaxID=1240361 RepID=A0A8T2AE81_9BRAS|nr:Retrotransposon gag domain [Arabidopsis thaliana x Arabidopsis arenosa]
MAPPAPVDVHTLKRDIEQLATAVQALAIQQEDYINVEPQEEDLRWEQGFKFELPEYHGRQSAEEFLDWIFTVEETLEFKRVPLERCVPMIVMRFRGRAAAWWSQLKASRARSGKPRILSWDKLNKKMRKTFLPFNYDQVMFQRLHMLRQGEDSVEKYSTQFFLLLTRVDLQDSDQQIVARFVGGLRKNIRDQLNLLNPLTVAEAHQQALTMEAQTCKDDDFWSKMVAWGIIVGLHGVSLSVLLFENSKSKKKRR